MQIFSILANSVSYNIIILLHYSVSFSDVQKLIHILKADIALAKQKWEKTKSLRESDLLEYTEKLKSLCIATSEDDIIMNEVDTK